MITSFDFEFITSLVGLEYFASGGRRQSRHGKNGGVRALTSFAETLLYLIDIAQDDESLDRARDSIVFSLEMETITRDEYVELCEAGVRRREALG